MRCKTSSLVAFMSIILVAAGTLSSVCDISIFEEDVPTYFIKGETFSLSCRLRCINVSIANIFWKTPGFEGSEHINIKNNDQKVGNTIFKYSNITVYNASKEDEGKYICIYNSSNGLTKKSAFIKTLVKPFITIEQKPKFNSITPDKMVQLSHSEIIVYEAYPPVTKWSLFKNGQEISVVNNVKKYEVNNFSDYIQVSIRNLTLEDTANYTLTLRSKLSEENYTYEVRPVTHPEMKVIPGPVIKTMRNNKISLKCIVTGYPLPTIKWHYPENGLINIIEKIETNTLLYNQTLLLEATIVDSSNITCTADNIKAMVAAFVYEVPGGFYIRNSSVNWYPENYNVTKECVASKYDFEKLIWASGDNRDLFNLSEYSATTLSYVSKLNIKNIKFNQSGEYQCIGYRKDKRLDKRTILITVAKTELPHIDGESYQDLDVSQYETVVMSCVIHAVPPPLIEWRKDDDILVNKTNTITIKTKSINETTVNSSLEIRHVQNKEKGKYICNATSGKVQVAKVYNLSIKGNVTARIIAAVAVTVIIILIAIVLYLYKKKKYYEKLFDEGCIQKLDPKLLINQQANLLPYNKKYEILEDKITLESLLGFGEFGEVYRATAIIEPGKVCTVAVKKVKKYADKTSIEALASELKILQHIGKHRNIVNLLGACTKNYVRGELLVIVEYCELGNLRNYLVNHRSIFIDHFIDHIQNGSGQVNRGFSSDNNVDSRIELSDCNCNPQRSNSTDRIRKSEPKVTASKYVSVSALKKNNISGSVSICSQDLLHWAYQIALGMEHLVSRRVLHGDLATRNILLARDNVVKICDFGLSSKLYEKAYCSKTPGSPLPVRWLAIECLTDLTFSTQSDIWAFGVVLWELFSLGMTPYPNKDTSSLLYYLLEGKRMPAPPCADDRLYKIMQQCWYEEPNRRPSFTQLREKLYPFLNDHILQQYMDMTPIQVSYRAEDDYVSMMCQPDFDTMSSINSHNYVVASPITTKQGTSSKLTYFKI